MNEEPAIRPAPGVACNGDAIASLEWRLDNAMALHATARESIDSVRGWLPCCDADYCDEDEVAWTDCEVALTNRRAER